MREGPDKYNVQVATETKETGLSAKRILNRQAEQVPPAELGAGRPETKMAIPMRAPLWYRHWGLNE
jgi:hypothetical protein